MKRNHELFNYVLGFYSPLSEATQKNFVNKNTNGSAGKRKNTKIKMQRTQQVYSYRYTHRSDIATNQRIDSKAVNCSDGKKTGWSRESVEERKKNNKIFSLTLSFRTRFRWHSRKKVVKQKRIDRRWNSVIFFYWNYEIDHFGYLS